MLGRNDRLDNIGKAVHVWERLDTKYNIVKGRPATRGSILGTLYNCEALAQQLDLAISNRLPYLGLNLSFPNAADLFLVRFELFLTIACPLLE